jgi:hypothetical protein
MKFNFLNLCALLLAFNLRLFSSAGENSEMQELSFDILFPISPMHQAITICMQIAGFFDTIQEKNGFCASHGQELMRKMGSLQNGMEELILNTNRFLHYDDLAYLAKLIQRIEQRCQRASLPSHDFDQLIAILDDVKLTLKEFE